jgi:hypothetical protein
MSSKPCKTGCGRPAVPGRTECEACRYARRKGRPVGHATDAPQPITVCEPAQPRDEVATALSTVRAVIGALAKGCPCVELRVLDLAAERLTLGLDRYGVMGEDDSRDMRREATEEAADGFVYSLRALVGRE